MDLVVDIQCCVNAENVHIPKEVAVLSLTNEYIGHWLVAPPYTEKKLPISVRNTNKWLSRYKHGLEWEDGYITKPVLINILRKISKTFDKVYVCGKEKKKILEKFIFNEIINIEEEEEADDVKYPAFKDLPHIETRCIIHAAKSESSASFTCALNNAVCLKNWLRQRNLEKFIDEQLGGFESVIADTAPYSGCVSG